jgi:UDP-N-acetylbacillosamine transaminase
VSKKIFLSPPHMSGKEQQYIAEVFESNYIAPLGAFVDRFEAAICGYTGASYALATNTATAALHLALRVLGIGEGDCVLASSFTFIGSVNAILYQNAVPLFVDSDESWNLSPALLKEAIHKAPQKPKALIVTHLYGQMAKMDEIMDICHAEGIYVIEDAAESLGASLHGRQSGTFGDMGVYSFNGNKILSTSGGGMLVSGNHAWIEEAKFLSTQAKEPFLHYEHHTYGYNYRMSNVLAAIGVAQMEVLDQRVARRREIHDYYREMLGGCAEVSFMPEIPDSRGNRWLTTLTFAKSDPARIIATLEEASIESRPLWKPMHMQPLFEKALAVTDGTSEHLFARGLCLPSGSSMSDSDVMCVAEHIRRVLG